MADEQHAARELADRSFQGFARPQVQVIGRFVQDQKVGIEGRHAGQGDPVAFAAAETADLLKYQVAGNAKPGQQVAPLLVDEFLVRRPDRLQDLR
ncbi:MAG: hypothetical protein MUE50_24405, partial [Pirellulaceae bacterium]|nr:hypothetical protein [Pirellulaceae bacterium]